jgi:hypothetical protein
MGTQVIPLLLCDFVMITGVLIADARRSTRHLATPFCGQEALDCWYELAISEAGR